MYAIQEANKVGHSSQQSRLNARRNELVSRGKNALLIMLERGIFTAVTSIRVTNELGAKQPFLLSVTGETAGIKDESIFNERFHSVLDLKDFAEDLAGVIFPVSESERSILLDRVSSWAGSVGTSMRIFPVS